MQFDIYEAITARIIEQLEAGLIPWEKPWSGTAAGAISFSTGKPYSLINQLLLQKPGEYITFNQCKELGGRVKKGSKSKMVVFWKIYQKQATDKDGNPAVGEDGKPIITGIPILKYYRVFHAEDDCEGIKPKHDQPVSEIAAAPDEKAEAVFTDYLSRTGCHFNSVLSDEAYYSPSRDLIVLPKREQFTSTAEYYSTMFHEATHSTGHTSRLNRFTASAANATFGSDSYSKEELVAEIGAATILHELGIETKGSFRNSAAYIQSWLGALKNDKKLIVSATSRAEKAAALILNQ